jgi:rod shape determining protein RodA
VEGVFVVNRLRAIVGDPQLALLVLAMSVFGVAMVYSAGAMDVPRPVIESAWQRQIVWLVVSLIAALVAMLVVPVRWLEWLAFPGYLAAVGMLIAVLFIGTGHGPAAATQRWLQIGPMLLQPSQFANLAGVLMLARVIGRWRSPPDSIFQLWKPIVIVAIPSMLVMMQPDLGTALVFGAVLLAAMYWGGTPVGIMFMLVSPVFGLLVAFEPWLFSVYMVILLAFLFFYRAKLWDAITVVAANLVAGTIAMPLWESMAPYQRNRIIIFMDPMIDPRGAGYQLIQSQIAIGSGGATGKGFLEGTQKRLAFLPEQHTDFIFSVIGEELGLIGTMAVVIGFGLILWRLVRIAERCVDPFAGIVAFGIFGIWATHMLVNIGMTVGVMPITGIPLPFLSYGGSFLIATFLALAFAQRVAAEARGRL